MSEWKPIFQYDTSLADKARNAIDAISTSVLNRQFLTQRSPCPQEDSLLFGYLGLALREKSWIERACVRMNEGIESITVPNRRLGLFRGLAGLGWILEHLRDVLGGSGPGTVEGTADDTTGVGVNRAIDRLVTRYLRCCSPRDQYDLVSGKVGLGIYLLERTRSSEQAVAGVQLIVRWLDSIARKNANSATWFTEPHLLPDWQRQVYPVGYYNLGVAHGIPGVIHFLSEAGAAGIESDLCASLVDGACRWLMAHALPGNSLSSFGNFVSEGQSGISRLAWCYGDPGIAAVLFQAGKRAGRRDWVQYSLELLDRCLTRRFDESGVIDAPICHGAGGLGHIFNRFYQSTGDCRHREAALDWFRIALDMRVPNHGVGGFYSNTRPDPDGPIVGEASPSFTDGGVGIALALLSSLEPIEPQWDRMLLLSGCTRN